MVETEACGALLALTLSFRCLYRLLSEFSPPQNLYLLVTSVDFIVYPVFPTVFHSVRR